MQILQLIDSLSAGGAERMAVNISNSLSENGHGVVLCATRCGGSLEQFVDKKVLYTQLDKKSKYDLFAFIRLLKLIRRNQIKLIHAHSSSVFWAVTAKLFLPRLKVIWHDHIGKRVEEDRFNSRIISISFLIDGVISVNEALKNWSIKRLAVDKDKIVFINNFPLLSVRHDAISKEERSIQIVCLANLRWEKDHFTLINAIDYLVTKHQLTNIRVIMAGLYYEDDYYNELKALIEDKQLSAYVEIRGPVGDTASLLYGADIGVLSSVSEGLPVSLLEYGLAGLPVVVTNVGQCADVVDNGNAGIVVLPSSPEQLAEALADLVSHPDKRKLMGFNLKERVEKEYGAGKFIEEYTQLINSLV